MYKVSVIVPNYNHAPYLRQRIDSILNQTYQDFELILLDDCSTDDSRKVLLSYKDNPHVTQIVFNETNVGSPYKQWKKAISLAQGEWVWIAESDDVAEKSFLETLLSISENNPKCALVFCESNYIDSNGKVIIQRESRKSITTYSGVEAILCGNVSICNVSSTIFKKEVAIGLQAPYTELRYSGDRMFYAAILQNHSITKCEIVLNRYRIHNTNVSGGFENKGIGKLENFYLLHYFKPVLQGKLFNSLLINLEKDFARGQYKPQSEYSRITIEKVRMEAKSMGGFLFELLFYFYQMCYYVKSKLR